MTGVLGAGWGLQVWPGTAATLLQGEKENRAVKTHPHSTQTTLQRGNQGTEGYKAKQSSPQGTARLCWEKRKLQTSVLAFGPCEPVPNRNLCRLFTGSSARHSCPHCLGGASPWELLLSHLGLEVTTALPGSLPRAFYF